MLREWLQREGVTLTDFSRRIGRAKGYVCTLAKDQNRTPSLELAFQIEEATRGDVPARYWYDRSLGRAA
ncbi:hypothetical protein [Maricaulis sp.]|uniref:hypothetical protein n=1 Tax=Maricaulis sp. TaxID=1486257 RepID=UPI000C4AC43F|nr:hypothetical protein [Maricaulis sp.]MAC89683.1 hypothetical protein [Maricaulis sp.]